MSIDSETLGLWESYKRMRESQDRDTAEAVRVEREAIATWHEGQLAALGVRWDQFSTLGMTSAANAALDKAAVHKEAIQAIRSGEHLKGEA